MKSNINMTSLRLDELISVRIKHVLYSESCHSFNYSNHLLTRNTLGNFTNEGHISTRIQYLVNYASRIHKTERISNQMNKNKKSFFQVNSGYTDSG